MVERRRARDKPPGETTMLKVGVCLNKARDGKIEITCVELVLGGGSYARPCDSEADAKKVLLAFGIKEDEADADLAALRDAQTMELLKVGDFEISDEMLAVNGLERSK
jgi:hypothetical protein